MEQKDVTVRPAKHEIVPGNGTTYVHAVRRTRALRVSRHSAIVLNKH